jgi:hypothetical protein
MALPPRNWLQSEDAAHRIAERYGCSIDEAKNALLGILQDGIVPSEGIPIKDGKMSNERQEIREEYWRRPFYKLDWELNGIEDQRGDAVFIDVRIYRISLDTWMEKYTPVPASNPAPPSLKSSGGRAPRWNWEGALIELIGVGHLDGLPIDKTPDGRGGQAEIERLMAAWFMAEYGEHPSESEIRKRATLIMQRIMKAGN